MTETRKVFALAALIIAAGVGTVEMTRGSAQADALRVAGGAAGYAGARIDTVFNMVAAIPLGTAGALKVADKGDLRAVTTAYDDGANGLRTVVEIKRGNSGSILTRLANISVAGF